MAILTMAVTDAVDLKTKRQFGIDNGNILINFLLLAIRPCFCLSYRLNPENFFYWR